MSEIKITLPDGATASKLVDLIVRDKPLNWSRKSYSAYYNKDCALWIQPFIDGLIANREPIVFRYALWPSVSEQTLYLRLNHSIRFLIDNLDHATDEHPKGFYASSLSDYEIVRKRGVGWIIKFRGIATGAAPEKYIEAVDKPKWKKQIENYLDIESPPEPLHIKNLLLTPEEIQEVKDELEGLSNVMFSVDCREIKILKE